MNRNLPKLILSLFILLLLAGPVVSWAQSEQVSMEDLQKMLVEQQKLLEQQQQLIEQLGLGDPAISSTANGSTFLVYSSYDQRPEYLSNRLTGRILITEE